MTIITVTQSYNNSTNISDTSPAGNSFIETNGPLTADITNSASIAEMGPTGDFEIAGTLTGTFTNATTGVIRATNPLSTDSAISTYVTGGFAAHATITGGIINSGTIASAASGSGAGAIEAGATSITNLAGGIILAAGVGAQAIGVGQASGTTITNAGTITATGSGGVAIGAYNTSVVGTLAINNSGTISQTAGGAGAAIDLNGVSPTLYGIYSTQFGVPASSLIKGVITATITNSGTISATGTGSGAGDIAVFGGTASINNQAGGSIGSTGAGAAAIWINGATASATIVNAGTISQSGGTAIDLSGAGTSSTISTSGVIAGGITLSSKADVVSITGGSISGDILAGAAGHGTVNIAVGAGGLFTAGGKLGDPAGSALAAVTITSGELSVNAANINASAVTFAGSATELALTGTASNFHSTIGGFAAGDSIDLVGAAATAVALNSSNQLVVSNGSTTVATLQLSGSYGGVSFTTSSDGAGGSLIKVAGGGSTVTNTTGAQTTLTAPNINTAVVGGGYDLLSLSSAPSSAYTLTANSDHSVTLAGGGGTDHVTGVMQMVFSDKTVTVEQANSMNEQIALLYQGALDRSPDAVGLAYWEQHSAVGLSAIAGAFASSTELVAKYGNLTGAALVTQLYQNVLDRAPDAAGLSYWVGQLASGASQAQVLTSFAESVEAAQNATAGFVGQSGAHAAWLLLT